MEKEYDTARLFKNNRAAGGLITDEELHDSDQPWSEAPNNLQENNEKVESSSNPNESSLPQIILSVLQKALVLLGLDRKN